MLKKWNLLLTSNSNLHICWSHTSPSLPSIPIPLLSQQRSSRRKEQHLRHYATLNSDNKGSGEALPWPTVPLPSPYQILHLSPQDVYSKHRFYTLVKIYHPDRSSNSNIYPGIHKLPGAIKMERYRLIVAANDVLSNPDKRKAYDRTGAGWNGRAKYDLSTSRHAWSQASSGARWSGFDTNDSPFHNATWEDWERWYNRNEKHEPVYASNGVFLSLVVVLLVIGAFGQAEQISWHNDLYMKKIQRQHEEATKTLRDRRHENQKVSDKASSIQAFVTRKKKGVPAVMDNVGNGGGDGKMLLEPAVSLNDVERKESRGGRGTQEENQRSTALSE